MPAQSAMGKWTRFQELENRFRQKPGRGTEKGPKRRENAAENLVAKKPVTR